MVEIPVQCPECGGHGIYFDARGTMDDNSEPDWITITRIWCDECLWERSMDEEPSFNVVVR